MSDLRTSGAANINHHCTVIELDGLGIAIEGPSGSGKTSLAFGLIEAAGSKGLVACFVCDDQALLEVRSGEILAHAPESIAGKAELHGFGIVDIDHKPQTRLGLLARLTGKVARMPEQHEANLLGVSLPMIEVPARHESQSARIVFAWLEANRTGTAHK